MKGRRFLALLFITALLLSCMAMGGCDSQPPGSPASSGQPAGSQEPPASESDETLSGLMSKWKNLEGVSYDLVMTKGSQVTRSQAWMQGKGVRLESINEEGQKEVMIVDIDSGDVYVYNPEKNQAMKMNNFEAQSAYSSPQDYEKMLQDASITVKPVETTTCQGMRCRVFSILDKDGQEVSRMWVSTEYGLPVKVETPLPDGAKYTMEYQNLKIEKLSREMFKLPPGVNVTSLDDIMKGRTNPEH